MAKVSLPKMSKMAKLPGGSKGAKPHIRMRKMKAVAPSAFPTSPMAFPPTGMPGAAPDQSMGAPSPDQSMAGPPLAMGGGASPGAAGG